MRLLPFGLATSIGALRGVSNNRFHSTSPAGAPFVLSAQRDGGSGDPLSRKELGERAWKGALGSAAAAFSVAIASTAISAEAQDAKGESRVILITGANSGIGKDAAAKLASAGHEVHVACRTREKADTAAELTGAKKGWVCDLADLDSIRAFTKEWGSKPIDVLCLNAGLAPGKGPIRRTAQGFEECVGTNHLGHYLLAQLLLKKVESGGSRSNPPRLVVTASGVHDAESPGGSVGSKATLGDLGGFQRAIDSGTGDFTMVDGGDYDYDKAYKDSKLCNVLFTREFNRRLLSKGSKVVTSCFSPGLIPSSGLFRSQNPVFATVFGFAAKNLLGIAATVGQGGDNLVDMAVGSGGAAPNAGLFLATAQGKPTSPFVPQPVSREAQDDTKAARLLDLSAKLVRLTREEIYV